MSALGFTFNAVHSSVYGVIMRSIDRSAFPGARSQSVTVPGRDGALFFAGDLEDRYIELECSIICDTATDMRTRIRQVIGWLYLQAKAELTFDDEPTLNYLAVVEDSIAIDQVTARAAQMKVTFRCDPLAYEDEDTTTDTITINGDELTAVVSGNYDTPCTIRLDNNGSTTLTQVVITRKTEV